MPRIRDIASRAGVSTTTVSHVLNQTRPVRAETAARVTKAVSELGYKPNILARSLRRRQTNTIGLLVSDIENPYFTELARAVETTSYERGFNVILCNTDEDVNKERLYVDLLFAKQVDGIILAPAPGDHGFLQSHLDDGALVVCVNRTAPGVPLPAVLGDDEDSMYALVYALLQDGHRRLGAIVGIQTVSTTVNRLKGVERAIAQYGLTLDDVWLFPGGARYEGGMQAAADLVTATTRPTAVVAFNSLMLDGILMGIHAHDAGLLRNIEITGFGYSKLLHVCRSSRRYVDQSAREVGRRAASLLLDVVTGAADRRLQTIVVQNTLVDLTKSLPDLPVDRALSPSLIQKSR